MHRTTAHLLGTLGLTWILHRLLVVTLAVAGVMNAGVPSRITWIGIPGGGGGKRFEQAVTLRRNHPDARVVVAGTRGECTFAHRLFQQAGVDRVRYLVVEPGTTRACVAALQQVTDPFGVLITDADHRFRLQVSWLLSDLSRIPAVISSGGGQPDGLEWFKALWYLARY